MPDLEDRTPVIHAIGGFTPGQSRWRGRARDFSRKPLLFRQLCFLALVILIAFPLWLWTLRGDTDDASPYSGIWEKYTDILPPVHHNTPHRHPHTTTEALSSHVNAVNLNTGTSYEHLHDSHAEELADADTAFEPLGGEIHRTAGELEKVYDPMTFALIIWGSDSAAEGAILLKSILMYTSGAVHFHIICDDSAHDYLEKRFNILTRPRHDIQVRFYRPNWQDMLDRIDREGTISTVHSAGTPGLMKLFIHEILPPTVKRVVFVDTDAFFISDPYLLWNHFKHTLAPTTVISMPTHPEMFAPQWFDANKICSCVMLMDLEGLRRIRLMDSSAYRAAKLGAYAPPAFRELFGAPDATTGKYENVALGDQTYWWAIIQYMDNHRVQPLSGSGHDQSGLPSMFEHLHYDWEVSSCLLDMYITDLEPGKDDATDEDELKVQLHTWATPHQQKVINPKLLHFNCLPGPRYFDWEGWDSPTDEHVAGTEGLAKRWGTSVKYHLGYKWLWLNRGAAGRSSSSSSDTSSDVTADVQGPKVTIETVHDIKFADELLGAAHQAVAQ